MKKAHHGELGIFQMDSGLPKTLKKVSPIDGKYIVAPSETTGNHHCVEAKEGVELFEKDGTLYLKNEVEAKVFCVIKERHDEITLDPGVWEITPAKEYDYLTEEVRNVAD